MKEEELNVQLLQDIVEEVIEIDQGQIERAISTISEQYQREIVQKYIDYLERIEESF